MAEPVTGELIPKNVAQQRAYGGANPTMLGQANGPALDRREELRRYIAANVVGANPPPLTAEARDLIRAALGSDQTGEASESAA